MVASTCRVRPNPSLKRTANGMAARPARRPLSIIRRTGLAAMPSSPA